MQRQKTKHISTKREITRERKRLWYIEHEQFGIRTPVLLAIPSCPTEIGCATLLASRKLVQELGWRVSSQTHSNCESTEIGFSMPLATQQTHKYQHGKRHLLMIYCIPNSRDARHKPAGHQTIGVAGVAAQVWPKSVVTVIVWVWP